jgi:hypothetical protein
MRIWFPLLLAPILALSDQTIAYATAGWACASQRPFAVHVVHAVFLVACLAGIAMAVTLFRETRAAEGDERHHVRHFLAGVSIASATLAALVIAAMWMPSWVLSPCLN